MILAMTLGPSYCLAESLPEGSYVYSDFCVGNQSWDVTGHRVALQVGRQDENAVTIQFDEAGADAGLINATPVHLDAVTGALEFSYQTQTDDYTFEGFVTADSLKGRFEHDQAPTVRKRQPAGPPSKPACAPRLSP